MRPDPHLLVAIALLLLAGGTVAATLLPHADRLEERCSPPVPSGAPIELHTTERIQMREGVLARVIEFTPVVGAERILLRTCASQEANIVREAREPLVRVILSARGHDADALEQDAEVKARAVHADGILYVVIATDLRGGASLPSMRVELAAPSSARASLEPWS